MVSPVTSRPGAFVPAISTTKPASTVPVARSTTATTAAVRTSVSGAAAPSDFTHSPKVSTLADRLSERRTARIFKGGKVESGPLKYESLKTPEPLTKAEQGALLFAAMGITHYANADLDQGSVIVDGKPASNIMVGLVGTTAPSADGGQFVSFIMMDDEGTYIVRRPSDFKREELLVLIEDGKNERWESIREKMLIKISDKRTHLPNPEYAQFGFNQNVNGSGTTYFLPVFDVSSYWLTACFAVFDEAFRASLLDSYNLLQSPGLKDFLVKKPKGAFRNFLSRSFDWLRGITPEERQAKEALRYLSTEPLKSHPIHFLKESALQACEFELGARVQNIQLMATALGLGSRPHFSGNPLFWGAALGFAQHPVKASTVLSADPVTKLMLTLFRKNTPMPTNVGYKNQSGKWLIPSYTPEVYGSVRAAVEAFVKDRFGDTGAFGPNGPGSAFKDPKTLKGIPHYTERQIEAVIALNEYLYKKYGTFPVGLDPIYIAGISAVEAGVLDLDFYEKFFLDGTLTEEQIARSSS